jgi:hypothetical protein
MGLMGFLFPRRKAIEQPIEVKSNESTKQISSVHLNDHELMLQCAKWSSELLSDANLAVKDAYEKVIKYHEASLYQVNQVRRTSIPREMLSLHRR